MLFYVYFLLDPISKEVKYVGCTKNPATRLSGHLSQRRPSKKTTWIKALTARGLKPDFQIYCVVDTEREAGAIELQQITANVATILNERLGGKMSAGFKNKTRKPKRWFGKDR